jgi:hypothetical protein
MQTGLVRLVVKLAEAPTHLLSAREIEAVTCRRGANFVSEIRAVASSIERVAKWGQRKGDALFNMPHEVLCVGRIAFILAHGFEPPACLQPTTKRVSMAVGISHLSQAGDVSNVSTLHYTDAQKLGEHQDVPRSQIGCSGSTVRQ